MYHVTDYAPSARALPGSLEHYALRPLRGKHVYLGELPQHHPAYRTILDLLDPDLAGYANRLREECPAGFSVQMEGWEEPPDSRDSGLVLHTEGVNGGRGVTVCVYPPAPGRGPWKGGEHVLLKKGGRPPPGDKIGSFAELGDFAGSGAWEVVPTAPAGGSWKVVCMSDSQMGIPLPATGGGPRRCIMFHVGFPAL